MSNFIALNIQLYNLMAGLCLVVGVIAMLGLAIGCAYEASRDRGLENDE